MLKIADKGILANAEPTLKTFELPALSYAGIKQPEAVTHKPNLPP